MGTRGRPILIAIATAIASAWGFAISTSLQHRAAGAAPATATTAPALLRHLVRQPFWVLGLVMGGVALVLHAAALGMGAITLVQPIMISGVIFAIFVRAGLDRRRPTTAEIRSVSLTAAGLAAFLVAATPAPGDQQREGTAVVMTVTGLALVVLTAAVAMRLKRARTRALLIGMAAGVVFGLTAGLMKLLVGDLDAVGVTGTLTGWRVWALVIAGVLGIGLNQRAYQIAPLAASMPALNTVDVLVAMLFGVVVFGEIPAHTPLALMVQAVGLVAMVLGLRQIARAEDAQETTAELSPPPVLPTRSNR